MSDLKNPKLIWLKGWLFLSLGLIASVILLLRAPQWEVAVLLAIAIWAFCRFYYFAFYVIEKYVDPGYRFAGVIDFVGYALKRENAASADPEDHRPTKSRAAPP